MVVVDESVEGVQDKLSHVMQAPASPLSLSGAISAADLPLFKQPHCFINFSPQHISEKDSHNPFHCPRTVRFSARSSWVACTMESLHNRAHDSAKTGVGQSLNLPNRLLVSAIVL